MELLWKSCDPMLFADAFNCKWDAKDQTITHPDEEALKAKEAAEEEAPKLCKDMINMHMITHQPSPPKPLLPPGARFDIADQSVTTINVHKKKKASNSAKAATTAKSTGDSNFSGNEDDDEDSASTNASGKPFAMVGFGKNTGTTTVDMTSDASKDDGSDKEGSAASGSIDQATGMGGKSR